MRFFHSTPSMGLRLLLASLLILPLFLGLVAWMLDRAFAEYQGQAQRESLRLQQLLLAKAVDWDGKQWRFQGLDEPRLNLLNSGLYALVVSGDGEVLWKSPSTEQLGDLASPVESVVAAAREAGLLQAAIGETRHASCELGSDHLCQATRVAWGSDGPESIFLVVENQSRIIAARQAYRMNLLWLCLGAALLLLLAQMLVVRWGLFPLRRMAVEVGRLERGEEDRLRGAYPDELQPLTENINILLDSEKGRRERVRNTMDRLTHVLKTPLMLIRNSSDDDSSFRPLVQEQVDRMLGIVEGELARARLDGRAADILGRPVEVRPVLQRIVDAYGRLPRRGSGPKLAHAPQIDTRGIDGDTVFLGEERDLQDLFGSVLENSIKYCDSRVVIAAHMKAGDDGPLLEIAVGDDGEGIPDGRERDILRRGARADTASVGQGLGLSIVIEIVSAYGGSLSVGRSALGGALFTISLPGARTPGSRVLPD